jgi:hypothetical protein
MTSFGGSNEEPLGELTPQGLRVPERFGVYIRWPEAGTDWIHPDDLQLAQRLIPGQRILHRRLFDGQHSHLFYGDLRIRVRPTLWLEVKTDGYMIGDQVEVRSELGQREPLIATIAEMVWNPNAQRVEYTLCQLDRQLPKTYVAEEFQFAFRLNEPSTVRQSELAAKSRLM